MIKIHAHNSCLNIHTLIDLFYVLLHLVIESLISWAAECDDIHNIDDVEKILIIGEVVEIYDLLLVFKNLLQPCVIFIMI